MMSETYIGEPKARTWLSKVCGKVRPWLEKSELVYIPGVALLIDLFGEP
jgi:hypothetical protein